MNRTEPIVLHMALAYAAPRPHHGATPWKDRVYVTKELPDGTVEAYNRGYHFLGVLTAEAQQQLAAHSLVVDTWTGWTGGNTSEAGFARWWEAK